MFDLLLHLQQGLSGSLVALCGAFSSFTDSYVGSDGRVYYGVVTRRGLRTFSPDPDAASRDLSSTPRCRCWCSPPSRSWTPTPWPALPGAGGQRAHHDGRAPPSSSAPSGQPWRPPAARPPRPQLQQPLRLHPGQASAAAPPRRTRRQEQPPHRQRPRRTGGEVSGRLPVRKRPVRRRPAGAPPGPHQPGQAAALQRRHLAASHGPLFAATVVGPTVAGGGDKGWVWFGV
ncbi:hypothetical protein SEVIR_7G329450v4 [Setaria viridis]